MAASRAKFDDTMNEGNDVDMEDTDTESEDENNDDDSDDDSVSDDDSDGEYEDAMNDKFGNNDSRDKTKAPNQHYLTNPNPHNVQNRTQEVDTEAQSSPPKGRGRGRGRGRSRGRGQSRDPGHSRLHDSSSKFSVDSDEVDRNKSGKKHIPQSQHGRSMPADDRYRDDSSFVGGTKYHDQDFTSSHDTRMGSAKRQEQQVYEDNYNPHRYHRSSPHTKTEPTHSRRPSGNKGKRTSVTRSPKHESGGGGPSSSKESYSPHASKYIKVEVTGFDSKFDPEYLQMYFENERRSGGGDIEEIVVNSDSCATITFRKPAVAQRVLKQSHTISGYKLAVVEKREEPGSSDTTDDNEQGNGGKVIEVSGFKATISQDMLEMYFENRRSGGGDISDIEMNPKSNKAIITFVDGSAVDRVLKRSHTLEGELLTVVEKRAQPSRPIDRHKIFLRGIPEGVSQETLELFIENRTKLVNPVIVYGEQPGTAMLTFRDEIQDLDSVIASFSKRKLKKATITAEQVKATNCILVQGLKPNTSDDMIELYFDNPRKCGGSGVSHFEHDRDENRALVYFDDWTVVNKVTARSHVLSGHSLIVTAHDECLGTTVSTDGPVPAIPKPFPYPVEAEIMRHVMGKHADTLTKLMPDVEVMWPCDGDSNRCLLKPMPRDGVDRSIWRNWKRDTESQLSKYLQQFVMEPIQIPRNIWGDIGDVLSGMKETLADVDVFEKGDKSIVILIGMSSTVGKAKDSISKSVDELKLKAEREAMTITKTVKVSPFKFKLFNLFSLQDDLMKSHPEIQITIATNSVTFKGIRGEISECQVAMYGIFENLPVRSFEMDSNKNEFIERFLDVVDGVLLSKNISAICDVSDTKISVHGKTVSDSDRAEKFLKANIVNKKLEIKSEPTMQALLSPSGKDKLDSLNDSKQVITDLDETNHKIQITGFTESVNTAIAEIGVFIEENVIIEKRIPFSPLQLEYLNKKCDKELKVIRTRHQEVEMTEQGEGDSGYFIKGNEKGTSAVGDMLENLKSKLIEKTFTVTKPGMPEHLRDPKGQRALQHTAREFDCVISTDKKSALKGDASVKSSIIKSGPPVSICHVITSQGYNGDLTKETTDTIVNAANSELKHIGGLAKAISTAGGPMIQRESDTIIKNLGRRLTTSEAVCTGAGHLPFQCIVHVPGPMWKGGKAHEEDLLYDAITNSLRQAKRKNLTSIAIPAISTGVFNFPVKLCAQTIVEATVDFMSKPGSSLKEVRFTNIVSDHCQAFHTALKAKFGTAVINDKTKGMRRRVDSKISKAPPATSSPTGAVAAPQHVFTKTSADAITTKEGVNVTLKTGSLAHETADVIVNTTAGEMDLSRGNVSKALLIAAGQVLQQEADAKVMQSDGTRRDVVAGDFIQTGPGNLQCKHVYHTHCPSFKDKDAIKVLQSMIKKVLEQALIDGMTSVAVPAIGTGNLGFPRDITARVMYDAVAEFSRDNPGTSLADIRFWVYDKDQPTIDAFEAEIQQRIIVTAPSTTPTPSKPKSSESKKKKKRGKAKKDAPNVTIAAEFPVTDDSPGEAARSYPVDVYTGSSETKFGSVSIHLHQGDLVKETSEAIVNTVGKDLTLKGVVSRALIRAGGKSISDECDQIRKASKPVPQVVRTTGGNLPSKYIYHVYLSGANNVKKMTHEILRMAEKDGVQSVSFPALGTGNIGGSPQDVAPQMIDAIGEFCINEKPTNLSSVQLAIFQADMIPVFEETLRSKAGDNFKKPKSRLQRGKAILGAAWSALSGGPTRSESKPSETLAEAEEEDRPKSLDIYIVAMDHSKIEKAIKSIEEYIKEEFYSEEVEGGDIELSPVMVSSIIKIGEKYKVSIATIPGKKAVLLEGTMATVLRTKTDIMSHFASIQAEEKRKAEEKLLSTEVQWRYQSSSGVYDDYDEEINSVIEKAYKEKKPSLDLEMEDGSVRIDFATMVEIDLSGVRPDMAINRADVNAERSTPAAKVPDTWIPMPDTFLEVVALVQGTAEYTKAENLFKTRLPNAQIVQVQRIQNKEIYVQYTARKDQMMTRLGRDTETTLFHGTSKDTVEKINKRGFNRSYSGKNAVAFGRGTYFAADVAYSARDTYSRPDSLNQKYIYICKVLVGDCQKGDSSMVMPTQKPNSPDIYDSTVDNVTSPSIVVVYHDAQAYPEYLVTFRNQ